MAAKKSAPRKALNETTSKEIAKVAGKVLAKGKATPAEARKLAGSALTQTKPKPKKKP